MLDIREVSPAPSSSEEEARLAQQHQAAMRFYIWAVSELATQAEPLPSQEFRRLGSIVDFARELYQAAKWEHELFRHNRET